MLTCLCSIFLQHKIRKKKNLFATNFLINFSFTFESHYENLLQCSRISHKYQGNFLISDHRCGY